MSSNPLDVQVGGQHYKECKIQPVEFMHANGMGYCEGAVVKYITRYRKKNGLQDLLKARHFIDLLISLEYPNQQMPEIEPASNSTQAEWLREQFEDIRILVDRVANTKVDYNVGLSTIQIQEAQEFIRLVRVRLNDLVNCGLLTQIDKKVPHGT